MPPIQQENRAVKVHTSLGANVLLFSAISGTEELCSLFDYSVELISENSEIKLDELLGTDMTIEMELPPARGGPKAKRYFHGWIAGCSQQDDSGKYAQYHFSLRPWMWFLTRTADCRIFQDLSVPEIIKQVFSDAGFSDFKVELKNSYETWRYCVQYRETDFNFLNRLMEQEGIYYYFQHEMGSHFLVLADGLTSHSDFPGYGEVAYYPLDSDQLREEDHISTWHLQKQLQPGKYVTRDFNFETPKANLQTSRSMPASHARADYEIFDYPGEYPGATGVPTAATGEPIAKYRMEEMAAQHEVANAHGNARGLATGHIFKLMKFDRADQNREYLITGSSCSISLDDYASGHTGETSFSTSISAISSRQAYRPPRTTPKPMVQGPQTAIVVGPSGEEIWTDKYGRVKLQFHWDRYGKSDENSSCWVRVSQLWAGQGWGAIHIPRIGHEVIVEFLEGDPDRPIITGRVYNGDNGVPYGLPANQTQSGIKSRSTKGGGGGNFNEIRMEDKKGEEELYIHAEKNHTNNTENDRVKWVGHNEAVNVDNDRTETVGHDETIAIGNDRKESVAANEHITIGKNRVEQVLQNEEIAVIMNRARQVGMNEDLTIGVNRAVKVGSNLVSSVGKNHSEEVGDNQKTDVGKDQTVSIAKNRQHSIGENDTLKVGKTLSIQAGDEISIVTGKAKIVMKKDGSISIEGKDISIKGSGLINAKASKNIVMKGKKILQN